MPEQQIVLMNGSRLMHDMLKRVLDKTGDLVVAADVASPNQLQTLLDEHIIHWVIITQDYDEDSAAWVEPIVATHPSVRFLFMSTDGSQIRISWLAPQLETLHIFSLTELIKILRMDSLDEKQGDSW